MGVAHAGPVTDRDLAIMGCEGTILVHEDGSCTCTDAGCQASTSRIVAMSRHAWFLACRDVLGPGCPVCGVARAAEDAEDEDAQD